MINAGYREQLSQTQKLTFEAFYTSIVNAGVYDGSLYASQVFDAFPPAAISYQGRERVYGIEASFDQALSGSFFWSANATLYKSQLETPRSGWVSSRFDGGYIFNLNLGKEFEKITERLARTWGISARLTILGGLRDREINAAQSALQETTVYRSALYSQKLGTYIRPDLSIYLIKNKGKRTIRWSLDIQNAASIRNAAYFYYDAVTGQVEEKAQLGIIPILGWRIGF
jgi:outer membrane receptor protein involved in Fe transport